MDRVVCYALTRNIYSTLIPSLKSLLANTHVDRVYVLAEDDELPFFTPECVKVINVSGQQWFHPDGPNYSKKWTWMVLMKAALTKVLPHEHKVLMMDADTLVLDDVGDLWTNDMEGYYLAGAKEPYWSVVYNRLYVNFGVVMLNLDKLRDGTDGRIIEALNTTEYQFAEQDCMNDLCRGNILELRSDYNANYWTKPTMNVRIRHYAAEVRWFENPNVQEWLRKNWVVKE